MTFRTLSTTISLVAVLVLPSLLCAQQTTLPAQQAPPRDWWNDGSQPTPGPNGMYTLRAGTQLVVQDITVTDANGKPVTGLKREDFHIFKDDRPQTIENFEEHGSIDPTLAEERVVHTGSKPGPGGTDGK